MSITKKKKMEFLRHKLSTDYRWAVRGLEIIFQHQTSDEQQSGHVTQHNGVGFTPVDAEFLTSLHAGVVKYGGLTGRQVPYLLKKMGKYARQIFEVSDQGILETQITKAVKEGTFTL